MNLRELIEDAAHQVSTYKHPNIDEARTQLDNILQAASLGSIQYDHIEWIEFDDENVTIETTWSARCCTNNSTYTFPEYILDAADPIREAQIWSIKQEIAKAEDAKSSAQADLKRAETRLTAALAKQQEQTIQFEGV